jgi:hypothetical protein
MALQIPIGALVDHVPAKRLLAAVAVAAISGSALLLALWPIFSVVLGAKVLHAIASCLAGPVLAAISLGLVGHTLLGSRLGRNARFLSLGNAIAAGLMGGVAYNRSTARGSAGRGWGWLQTCRVAVEYNIRCGAGGIVAQAENLARDGSGR